MVASGILTGVLAGRGWFYYDDFWNLTVAHDLGWAWDFLGRPVFGHVTPGANVLIGLVAGPGHDQYRWAVAMLGAMGAAVPLAASATARQVGARPWPAAVAGALAASAAPLAAASTWWSAGVNLYPSMLAGMGVLAGAEAGRRGARWGIGLGATSLLVGLSFTEGAAVFLVPPLVLAVADARGGPVDRARELWGQRRSWALLLAPLVAALVVRASAAGELGVPVRPGLIDLITFPVAFLARGLLPSLVGLVPGRVDLVGSSAVTLVVGVLAAVMAAVLALRAAGRAVLVPIVAVALTVLARGALVAWGRLELLGWDHAVEARYLADLIWLVPVLVAGRWPSARRARPVRVGAAARAAVVALLGVGVVGQVAVAVQAPSRESRRYRDRLAESWAQAPAGSSVVDALVPATVLGPQFGEFLFLSHTAARGVPGLRFAPTDRLLAPDDSGRLQPVRLAPLTELVPDQAFTAVGEPDVQHDDGCWVAGDRSALVWVPLTRPVTTGPWVLDLRLAGRSDAHIALVAAGMAPSRYIGASPQGRGERRWIVSTVPFEASQIGFEVPADARLCLAGGAVTQAVPAS